MTVRGHSAIKCFTCNLPHSRLIHKHTINLCVIEIFNKHTFNRSNEDYLIVLEIYSIPKAFMRAVVHVRHFKPRHSFITLTCYLSKLTI